MPQAEVDDALTVLNSKAVGKKRNGLRRITAHGGECAFKFFATARREIVGMQAKLASVLLCVIALKVLARMPRIGDDRDTPQIGNCIAQEFEALAVELGGHECQAGHVAARAREAFCEAGRYGITTIHIN